MRISKSLLVSTALVAIASFATAQDAPEAEPTEVVETVNGTANAFPVFTIVSDESAVNDVDETEADALAASSDGYQEKKKSYSNNALKPYGGYQPQCKVTTKGQPKARFRNALIIDERNFCILAPSKDGQRIADAFEGGFTAKPFCTDPLNKVLKTGYLKGGSITDTTVEECDDYIQIYGKINNEKLKFDPNDYGAQYDDEIIDEIVEADKQVTCQGYKHFVQFIEPNQNTFCLRCCRNRQDCPVDKAHLGCAAALGINLWK
ncbi:hypothetical protein BGX28_005620 [Mortierella sp. GBA30]|nr:hypothetical protein BGX28_005620 [Mortierella sp. GBA30]